MFASELLVRQSDFSSALGLFPPETRSQTHVFGVLTTVENFLLLFLSFSESCNFNDGLLHLREKALLVSGVKRPARGRRCLVLFLLTIY